MFYVHKNACSLGHKTNILPLALEPITHVLNVHGIYMLIELSLIQCLRERISYIMICGDPFNLHSLSTDDLPDQVVAPENMFGSLMRPWFLGLCNSPIVIRIQWFWINNTRDHSRFSNELLNPNSFFCCIRSCYVLGFSS